MRTLPIPFFSNWMDVNPAVAGSDVQNVLYLAITPAMQAGDLGQVLTVTD